MNVIKSYICVSLTAEFIHKRNAYNLDELIGKLTTTRTLINLELKAILKNALLFFFQFHVLCQCPEKTWHEQRITGNNEQKRWYFNF